jgi:hypothetical protein
MKRSNEQKAEESILKSILPEWWMKAVDSAGT